MTVLGWLFLIVSVGSVWGLAIWCYSKVLGGEPPASEDPPPQPERQDGR